MPPKSNVPIRICGSKTRSGCKTCKQRHVKCDERQPVCLRCQKADRQCVYVQPPSSTRQQSPASDKANQDTMLVARQIHNYFEPANPTISVGLYGSCDVVEICAVKHFAADLGKNLAGCFSDNVWCHILPQVAQHEPTIWHATVAIGMLDSKVRIKHKGTWGSSNITPAIKHYTKAIRQLSLRLQSVDDPCSKGVILLSCVLFAVFECMQSHYRSALQHVTGGLKLLTDWEHEACSAGQDTVVGYLDYRLLQPIFLALESQAIQMGIISCQDHSSWSAVKNQWQLPTCFTSTQEAHLALNRIFNELSHWMVGIDPDADYGNKPQDIQTVVQGQRLRIQLTQWDSAISPLLRSVSNQPSTLLLMTQRKVIQTLINRNTDGLGETAWDVSLPLFREAVEYAERYMFMTTGSRTSHKSDGKIPMETGPVLTIAMDIVMSLFLISAKCRDMMIRRRALAMLKVCNRKEGVWDSNECAFLAERMIESEESSAEQDGYIPESARIYELDVQLDEDNVASIKAKKIHLAQDGHHRLQTAESDMFEISP